MRSFVRTVLLVDDNTPLRESLAMLLQDEGVETVEAGTGAEAVGLCVAHTLDLAVLDLNLPDMTGVTIYETIARRWTRLPCIFMTAEALPELVDQALRVGPLGLLRKPFEMHDFRDLVRRAIAV